MPDEVTVSTKLGLFIMGIAISAVVLGFAGSAFLGWWIGYAVIAGIILVWVFLVTVTIAIVKSVLNTGWENKND